MRRLTTASCTGAPRNAASQTTGALDAETRVAGLGLAKPVSLGRWTFDAGTAHFDATADRFKAAFTALPRP